MNQKEKMANLLYERMRQENEVFIAELKTKPPEEIIRRAYEVACRQDILMLFEDETSLSERQLKTLLEYENPLAELYDDWLNRDTDGMDAFRNSVSCCADDMMKYQAERKYDNPNEPQYGKTYEEARICDELPEWRANHLRNTECVQAFHKSAPDAYHNRQFRDFLEKWAAHYGKERCKLVLSCIISARKGDGRFYPSTLQLASQFESQRAVLGTHIMNYTSNVHSVIVNSAMEYFAREEYIHRRENNTYIKKNQQQDR